jgi:hypothetical protein
MRRSPFVLILLSLSATPSWCGDAGPRSISISEEAVRIASARAYSDLLRQAYRNGRRYTSRAIENGFRRHFEELKLQLLDDGYTITPSFEQQLSGLSWTPNFR